MDIILLFNSVYIVHYLAVVIVVDSYQVSVSDSHDSSLIIVIVQEYVLAKALSRSKNPILLEVVYIMDVCLDFSVLDVHLNATLHDYIQFIVFWRLFFFDETFIFSILMLLACQNHELFYKIIHFFEHILHVFAEFGNY